MQERVIALGFFDGVHRGHGALLRRAAEEARRRGCTPAVFTFDRPPKEDGKWHSDTATVSIVEKGGHPGILLEQFEVESAEDPNQY